MTKCVQALPSRSSTQLPVQRTLAVIVVGAGLVAGCSSPTASSSAGSSPAAIPGQADHVISITELTFTPEALTMAAGETVRFRNDHSRSDGHRIVQGEDGSEVDDPAFEAFELLPGELSSLVSFEEPGTYHVTCTVHPEMNMVITVE